MALSKKSMTPPTRKKPPVADVLAADTCEARAEGSNAHGRKGQGLASGAEDNPNLCRLGQSPFNSKCQCSGGTSLRRQGTRTLGIRQPH
jgi:hypothetical protein